MSNLCKINQNDSDNEEEEEEDDENKDKDMPVISAAAVKHPGCVNRIRVSHFYI